MMAAALEAGLEKLAISVEYCDQCTLPIEYCEFTDCSKRKTVTEQSGEQGDSTGDDAHKRQTRGGKALGPKSKKLPEKRCQVFRSNRGKKKFVTVIVGLGTFGVDLKDASKLFSKKFACSSSVTGPDEIVIQGDVKDDLFELIPEKFPEVDEALIDDAGDQKR